MKIRDILKTVEKNKEYIEKFNFILRHRNNLDCVHPTFNEHNIQYKDLFDKLTLQYEEWLEQEIE
jgi:hypothetical protein